MTVAEKGKHIKMLQEDGWMISNFQTVPQRRSFTSYRTKRFRNKLLSLEKKKKKFEPVQWKGRHQKEGINIKGEQKEEEEEEEE